MDEKQNARNPALSLLQQFRNNSRQSTVESIAMTHSEMCDIAAKFLQEHGFNVSFDDRLKTINSNGEQPDAIGFRRGASCLIEVKMSRSDFLADKKKRFRKKPELGMGDWRFYLSPPGVIKPEDLPQGWGLLYAYPYANVNTKVGERGGICDCISVCVCVRKVHGWPPNNNWYKHKPFKSNKQAECDITCNALRRLQLRGYLDAIYEGYRHGQ